MGVGPLARDVTLESAYAEKGKSRTRGLSVSHGTQPETTTDCDKDLNKWVHQRRTGATPPALTGSRKELRRKKKIQAATASTA